MAANTTPIFTKAPRVGVSGAAVTAANTTRDGSSGTKYTVFTAGAEGSYLQRLIVRPLGSNAQTVMRVFFSTGDDSVAANNTLIDEQTMLLTAASETAMLNPQVFNLFWAMPAGSKIFVTLGTAVSAGFHVTAIGGDY